MISWLVILPAPHVPKHTTLQGEHAKPPPREQSCILTASIGRGLHQMKEGIKGGRQDVHLPAGQARPVRQLRRCLPRREGFEFAGALAHRHAPLRHGRRRQPRRTTVRRSESASSPAATLRLPQHAGLRQKARLTHAKHAQCARASLATAPRDVARIRFFQRDTRIIALADASMAAQSAPSGKPRSSPEARTVQGCCVSRVLSHYESNVNGTPL